jgi:hypothetical protein
MYGIPSTQEQLATIRDASGNGIALAHVDTCLGSFLNDHHNRDGECLFGVVVDGNSTNLDVLEGLRSEYISTGDRVLASVEDSAVFDAIDEWFAGRDLKALFDSRLEVIDEDEAETMGGDEMCQAWFVLTWETLAAKLRNRQDVTSVDELSGDRFEVTDDVGATFVGTFEETLAWLNAGLDEEESAT